MVGNWPQSLIRQRSRHSKWPLKSLLAIPMPKCGLEGHIPWAEWRPFQSPVDFTVWFAKDPSSRDLNAVRQNYERLQKVFPLTGGLNLYVATEAPLVSGIVNPFELERDPQLKKKFNRERNSRAGACRDLFFRTLEKELDDVLNSPGRV